MRSFVVLLLLVVVFLAGMLIGIDKEREAMIAKQQVENVVEKNSSNTKGLEHVPSVEENEVVVYEQGGPEQTTQKMAFFLEDIVKGFYEIIVEILYQMSSLFV